MSAQPNVPPLESEPQTAESKASPPPSEPASTQPDSPKAPIYNWGDLSQITVSKEWWTPEMGRSAATGNVRNRGWTQKHTNKLLGIYNRGNWKFNGDPIVFDKNGCLVQGQHRAYMIWLCGQTVPVLVVRGVDPDVFGTYDLGKRRTLKDIISIPGLDVDESPTVLASAIGYLAAYLKSKTFKTSLCAEDERVDTYEDHDAISDYAKLYKSKNRLRISGGLLAALHYLFAQKNRGQADEFMAGILEGEILENTDPAWRFREWVDRKMGTKRTSKTLNMAGQTLIKAWNHFRVGDKLDAPLRPPAISPDIE
jgi:hypothetical protein